MRTLCHCQCRPATAVIERFARRLLAALILIAAGSAAAQSLPTPDDTRHSMLREAMLGVLRDQPAVAEVEARRRCLDLPAAPPDDRLLGPHGDRLLDAHCEIIAYSDLVEDWRTARYRWTSVFTAEDAARGPAARDTVIEEEALLFEPAGAGNVHPVWHTRFETGPFALYRSIVPEIALASHGIMLVSILACLNGTGGCGQEFLSRHGDGRFFPVWQTWLDRLPRGFVSRIRHGGQIDPRKLHGEAPLYDDGDANCCPSHRLLFTLALHGDTLDLVTYRVVSEAKN